MNLIDILIIMVLLSFFIIGFHRGVIKEAVSFLGIVIVFVLSYILKDYVGNFLCINLPFIEFEGVLENISSFNILFYQALAFILVFVILIGIYILLVKTSSVLQKVVNFTIILVIPSKILGGIIGALKGWLIVFLLLITIMLPLGSRSIMRESKLSKIVLYKTPIVSQYTNKLTSTMKEVFDVTHKVNKKKMTASEANDKCLDIMLKYKMVDKRTVEKLIELQKIKNTDQVKSILANY